MGWDQSIGRQSVRDFLLELMGINPDQLLREALELHMGEAGLTYEEAPAEGREEGDGMYNVFTPDVITLSDGRVFIESCTESTNGDDWGNDFYSFVEVGKPFKYTRNDYCGCENDPHVSKEEMISTYMLPSPYPDRKAAVAHTKAQQHHPECNDITRCHPDCAFAREREEGRVSEDRDTPQHHVLCKDQRHPFCALAVHPEEED